jgi:DNA-directed RNA polymerase specialized sigma subunit
MEMELAPGGRRCDRKRRDGSTQSGRNGHARARHRTDLGRTTATTRISQDSEASNHKLVDHWRRFEREQRSHTAAEASATDVDDPWDEWLDTEAAYTALARLPIQQRAALTLRYLDGLPVADVAEHLGRTVHGTETLMARSRAALRRQYQEGHHHAR